MRGKHIELVFIFDNQIISPLLFIVSMEFRDFISARVYTVCRPAFLHLWVLSMPSIRFSSNNFCIRYSEMPHFLEAAFTEMKSISTIIILLQQYTLILYGITNNIKFVSAKHENKYYIT